MPYVSSSRVGDRLSNHVNRRIPKNSVALMRSIEVVCGGQVIGYIQNITMSESRNVWECREVGNEDLAELTPGGPEQMTINMKRMLLYHSRIINILDDFGGLHGNERPGLRTLMDANVPFDILILMRRHSKENINPESATDPLDDQVTMPGGEQADGRSQDPVVILDWFHECWLTKSSYQVEAKAEFQIIEDADIKYTWRSGSPLFQSDYIYEGGSTTLNNIE